jgi:AbrB family looped-hinge helix DNA binding protein
MIKATVSSKGQIVIPGKIRTELNLKPGTQLAIDIKGETLIMKKISSAFSDWRTMQGMVRGGPSLTQALEEDHRAELERDDARLQSLCLPH